MSSTARVDDTIRWLRTYGLDMLGAEEITVTRVDTDSIQFACAADDEAECAPDTMTLYREGGKVYAESDGQHAELPADIADAAIAMIEEDWSA